MKQFLKSAIRPLRVAAGRFVVPAEPPTSMIIFKAAELTSTEQVEGDYLEFGVFRGSTMIQAFNTIRTSYLDRSADRTHIHSAAFRDNVRSSWDAMRFFAFDSFQGLPALSGVDLQTRDFSEGKYACSQERFLARIAENGVDLSRVVTVPGWFEQTCQEDTIRRHNMKAAAIVHIDCDLYESTRVVLQFITPLLVDGTVLIFDDWFAFRGNPGLGEQRAFHEWTPSVPHLTFTQFQKEGPWRNSFIVNVRPDGR
jgi:O-methyltransferase